MKSFAWVIHHFLIFSMPCSVIFAGQVPTSRPSARTQKPVEVATPSSSPGLPAQNLPEGKSGPMSPEEKAFLQKIQALKTTAPKDEAEEAKFRTEFVAAVKEYIRKFPKSPRVPMAVQTLVGLFLSSGEIVAAESVCLDYHQAAKQPAEQALATQLLVEFYSTTQQPAKAVDHIRNLLKNKAAGEHEPVFKYRLASFLSELEKDEDALAILREFIKANPVHQRTPQFKLKVIDVLLNIDRPKDAIAEIESFQKGALTDSDKALASYFLGMGHLILARTLSGAEAEASMKKSLAAFDPLLAQIRADPAANQPLAPMVYSAVADVHLSRADKAAAVRCFEEMKRLFKDRPEGGFADKCLAEFARIGEKAPEFTATGLDGKPFSLASHAGKIVLLDFWATWCAPCRAEIPILRGLAKAAQGKPLVIVGISLDKMESKDALVRLVAQERMTWPQVFDGKALESPVAKHYGVTSLPCIYLIDEKGTIVRAGLRGPQMKSIGMSEVRRLELELKAPKSPMSPASSPKK